MLFNWDSANNATLDSPYSIPLPSGDGTHVLNIYAVDGVGNWVSQQYTFIIDDTSPSVTLITPEEDSVNLPGAIIVLEITDTNSI